MDFYHSDGPRLGKGYLLILLHQSSSTEFKEKQGNFWKQRQTTFQNRTSLRPGKWNE